MVLSRSELLEHLNNAGIRASRALGQNFVADANTVRRIARLAELEPGQRVVEIGAGVGSLTLALAETGAAVTAVEVDSRLVKVLRQLVEPVGVEVLEADAMTLDWESLLAPGGSGWSVVGNLPYNLATPLIVKLLEEVPAAERMLVMVQREVGERLAAGPATPAYGAVSVKIAYWASASVVGKVPATVFVPKPKVSSTLVKIERRSEVAVELQVATYEEIFSLVRAGFATRRKMLRRSLDGMVGPEAFAAAGVRPDARAEELGVKEWGKLAAARRSSIA